MESVIVRKKNAATICAILFLVGIHVIGTSAEPAHASSMQGTSFRTDTWNPLQVSMKGPIGNPSTYPWNPNGVQMSTFTHLDSSDSEQEFQAWLDYIRTTSNSPLDEREADNLQSLDAVAARAQGQQDDSSDWELSTWNNTESQTISNSMQKNKLTPRMQITVARDGSGDVRSVQEAVDRVPRNFNERVVIHIKAGVYREKVRISKDKPYITLEGDSKSRTIITYDSTASDTWGKRHIPMRTYQSATVAVNSQFFIAKNIVFRNSAPIPAPGAVGKQAVAFRISADMAAFYRCSFLGSQDTLYDHHGRHYFKNCYIEGTVDFVFGNGRSLYKNCHLNALNNSGQIGSVTAQKRNETTLDTGFSFVNSRISGSGQVYLGRAWGRDSRVVFSYSYMDSVVVPVGWNDWGLPHREKTAYYAEFSCTGPGAPKKGQLANWARILSKREARPFLTTAFINGKYWLPSF